MTSSWGTRDSNKEGADSPGFAFTCFLTVIVCGSFDARRKWGRCAELVSGQWSTWSLEGQCSRSCGGGRMITKRRCMRPPCSGKTQKMGAECNTRRCPECFHGKGENFRGSINEANDGTECQRWSVHHPHDHPDTSVNIYPELEANYCRNPGALLEAPWCYRKTEDGPARMYCDVPLCGTDFNRGRIAYTIPSSLGKGTNQNPCVFPYKYQSEWYDACLLLDTTLPGTEKCFTSPSKDQRHFNFCPLFYRGTWSSWKYEKDCSKSCGGGRQVRFRVCLLTPCFGPAIRTDEILACNTHPCPPAQPGSLECFTGSGVLYSGKAAKSISGQSCRAWDDVQTPFDNNMLADEYPRLVSNYCRNPSPGAMSAPWCYVRTAGVVYREYCDVAVCPTMTGEIFGIYFNKVTFRGTNRPCLFPYYGADSKYHHGCQPVDSTRPDLLKYCALERITNSTTSMDPTSVAPTTQNLGSLIAQRLREGLYGLCPPSTRGTWSPWVNVGSCSVFCGGGQIRRTRRCRHPPCSSAESTSQPCNTQKCLTCLQGRGTLYGGKIKQSFQGKVCMRWESFEKKATDFKPSKYPELESNYCRNPGGMLKLPWCYVNDRMVKSPCEVPHCNDSNLHHVPYTLPIWGNDVSAGPCYAPYLYKGDWYFSCLSVANAKSFNYCPRTSELKSDEKAWAVCPSIYRKRWSAWNRTTTCSKPCGGGKWMNIRECLYLPCNGSKLKFEGKCNTNPCFQNNTMRANVKCFIGEGQAYTGSVSITLSKFKCQDWNRQEPNQHHYAISGSGLDLNHNLCRNPAPFGHRLAPWCFVLPRHNVKQQRWEYCDIPRCHSHEGEIRTVGGADIDKPCNFPFTKGKNVFETCISIEVGLDSTKSGMLNRYYAYCATSPDLDKHPSKWGVCPSAMSGTMGPWTVWHGSGWCSRPCGGGRVKLYRTCRIAPCRDSSRQEKYAGTCNTQTCEECVRGDGTTYRGMTVVLPIGYRCRKWNSVRFDVALYSRADVLEGGDHSFCRNPNPERYKTPFCFAENAAQGGGPKITMCDLSKCEPVRELVTVAGATHQVGRRCTFPFKVNGKLVESCQKMPQVNQFYCGVQTGKWDVLSDGAFGICSMLDRGVWGDWFDTGKCSAFCGGGKAIFRRHCRFTPCSGESEKHEQSCNQHVCDKRTTCYDLSTLGREFNGNLITFADGRSCQSWQNSPDFDQIRGENPDLDFSAPSCRNPNGKKPRPYCITNEPGEQLTIAYCDVPPCPASAASSIFVKTSQTDKRPAYSPCVFPFHFRGTLYHHCTDRARAPDPRSRSSSKKAWCGTARVVDKDEWGYCPVQSRGQWSEWSDTSRVCTAACVWFQERQCLFEPCSGRQWRLQPQNCAESACVIASWSDWGHWTQCKSCLLVRTRHRECRFARPSSVEPQCHGASVDSESCPPFSSETCDRHFANLYLSEEDVSETIEYYSSLLPASSSTDSLRLRGTYLLSGSTLTACLLWSTWKK